MGSTYWQGLGIGASLIVAIGAQNAHVLRVGIARRHVALTVGTCIAVDGLLICLGVAGMGVLIADSPLLMAAVRYVQVAPMAGSVAVSEFGEAPLRALAHPACRPP